ncbi:MAG: glycerophosphodiester phosphodiesterase family protein, partial [Rhodobacterales bacterium]
MRRVSVLGCGALLAFSAALPAKAQDVGLSYGVRPFYLIDKLEEGALKDKLMSCRGQTPERSDFSIGHRGAPLMFPEHTAESYTAAAHMGAGIVECDVTFTKDKELVCRHAQNDLATTTNILVSDLAGTCVTPFTPANGDAAATAECRTSELTLAEFKSLTPKMDSSDKTATSAEAFQGGNADFRTTLYAEQPAHLMTLAESITLIGDMGGKFTPELKNASVEMPFEGFTQEMYAQKLVDSFEAAGVPAADVWMQSFDLSDI